MSERKYYQNPIYDCFILQLTLITIILEYKIFAYFNIPLNANFGQTNYFTQVINSIISFSKIKFSKYSNIFMQVEKNISRNISCLFIKFYFEFNHPISQI